MADHGTSSPAAAKKDALDHLADEIAKEGLASLLADTDIATHAVDWIVEEFGTRKITARLAVRVIATLASAGAEKGGEWLSDVAKQQMKALFLRLPFAKQLEAKAKTFIGYLDKDLRAKNEVKKVLSGGIRPRDAEYADELKEEMRVGLEALVKLDELSEAIAVLKELVSPQPLLNLPLFDEGPEGLNRFFFGTQKVPLCGRDADLAALEEFLATPASFGWWLVAGPGGLGKSRLALELCLRQGMVWRAGFLPSDYTAEHFRSWQPNQPTLIVIDYVMSRAEAIGQLCRTLYLRRKELTFPVRLLLLEREAQGDWLDRMHGGRGSDRATLLAARYAEPHILKPLSPDDLWRTITSMLDDASRPHPDKRATLALLSQMDPEGRPLFAALLADALAAGASPWQWNRMVLLKSVLEREEANWWKTADITDADKELLAIATLCGGLRRDEKHPQEIAVRLAEFSPQRYRAMTGENAAERLTPLQPDIIGELFVLESLSPANTSGTVIDAFRNAAWEENEGAGISEFLYRAAYDFAPHPALRQLMVAATQTSITRAKWARAATDLVIALGGKDIESAEQILAALVTLAQSHPGERVLRVEQAKASYNLINAWCRRERLVKAKEVYDELVNLATHYPDDSALSERQAKAVVNLIPSCKFWDQTTLAQQLYDEVVALAVKYNNSWFRERQAEAAVNLMNAYTDVDTTKLMGIYRSLVELVDANPAEPLLALALMQALRNRLASAFRSDDLEEARQVYEQLVRLARQYADLITIGETAKDAAIRILIAYGDAGQIAKSQEFYDELKMAAADAGSAEARRMQANAAFNLVSIYGNAGHLAQAHKVFEEVAALAASYPAEPVLRWDRSVAGFNLISSYHRAREIDSERQVYDELEKFASNHLDEHQLRELQARASILLVSSYGEAGDLTSARGLYDSIAVLAAAHPNEPPLRKHLAAVSFNLMNARWEKDDRPSAILMYDRLVSLAHSHAQEAELRLTQGSAALNLIIRYSDAGELDEARRLHGELVSLCRQYKSEGAFCDTGVKASLLLYDFYKNGGNTKLAKEMLRDAEQLSGTDMIVSS
jgi:tetratricopeptide (TPR) repeat protein